MDIFKSKLSYKWELVILLWVTFFLNQADRQIFNIVLPLIKEDLGFTDRELGLIASSLIWAYGLLVPIAGFLGDIFNRKWIVVNSLVFWSVATLFTGTGYLLIHFIMIRGIATGGAEAFYAPTANALISKEHEKTRAFAMSIHQTALYAGIILSGFLAGYIGEHYGWRVAFYIFGLAGILLGVVLFFRLKDSINEREIGQSSLSILKVVPVFFKNKTAILLSLAFAGMVFVNVGYLTWMPTFLYENFNLSLSSAGFNSMFYHHIAAFAGVLAGGKIADFYVSKNNRARMLIQAIGLLGGAPFIYLVGNSESLVVVYIALAVFGFFRGVYDSNIFASLFDVIEPKYRSSAVGIMLMFAFLTGAFAPYILGYLKPLAGLSAGFFLLAIVYLISCGILIIASYTTLEKDYIKES